MANKHSATKRNLLTSLAATGLSVTMLVGTTFAWFTDSVTSTGNVIQSGTLDVTMEYKSTEIEMWKDASTGAIFNYKNWEPGYTDVKYIKVENEGSLAAKYMINIYPSMEVEEGKLNLADVIDVYVVQNITGDITEADLNDTTYACTLSQFMLLANADGAINGVVGADENNVFAIALKMQESAGNEYQNLSVGDGVIVQLVATQANVESDSFGNAYDAGVEHIKLPKAKINKVQKEELEELNEELKQQGIVISSTSTQPIAMMSSRASDVPEGFEVSNTVTLDSAYTFAVPQDELASGEFRNKTYSKWHADFVVTFDRDVKAGSMGVAGYYESWCKKNTGDRWLGIILPEDIKANESVRLLSNFAFVSYEELFTVVKQFDCGVFNLADENEGITMTVEIRLYETFSGIVNGINSVNHETGKYITVNAQNYQFGKVSDANRR